MYWFICYRHLIKLSNRTKFSIEFVVFLTASVKVLQSIPLVRLLFGIDLRHFYIYSILKNITNVFFYSLRYFTIQIAQIFYLPLFAILYLVICARLAQSVERETFINMLKKGKKSQGQGFEPLIGRIFFS